MDGLANLEVAAGIATAGAAALAYGAAGRDAALAKGGVLSRLVLPAEFDERGMELALGGLHGALRPRLRRLLEGQPYISIELAARPESLAIEVWTPAVIGVDFVAAQVAAAFPGARLEPVEQTPAGNDAEGVVAGSWVDVRGGGQLRTDTATPGFAALASGLCGLGGGETARLQLLLQPLSPGAQARLQLRADELARGHRDADGRHVAPSAAERARARQLQAKADRPLFAVSIRLVATAATQAAAARRLGVVSAGFHAFATGEVHFARRRAWNRHRLERAVTERRWVRQPAPAQLNTMELAALLRINPTVAREAGVETAAGRVLAPPVDVPTRGIVLGVSESAAGRRPVAVSVEDARRHIYVLAPTGSGKTELLAGIAAQSMAAGRSTIVIDPKGDLFEAALRRVPLARRDDVVIVDPSDAAWPVGLNMLEVRPGEDAERVCDDLVAIFHGIYASSWGPRTNDILKASFLTLVQTRGSTLAEVPSLLGDEAFRQRYVRRVHDPFLAAFWGWYEDLSPAARSEVAGPVLNKLRDILLRSRIRNCVGVSRSSVNFDDTLNERGILLANLSKGLIGDEPAALLGAFIVARLWQSTRRRAAIPAEERRDATLIVDEFQDVVALPTSFEDVLAQARSLRVGAVLAHQHAAQLPLALRQAVLSNARTKLVLQLAAADARLLAREFAPYLTEADLRGLGRFQAAAAVSVNGNTSRPFTAYTQLAPPPTGVDPDEIRERARTAHARPRTAVEAEILHRLAGPAPSRSGRFGRRSVTDRVTDRLHEAEAQTQQPGGLSPDSGRDSTGGTR